MFKGLKNRCFKGPLNEECTKKHETCAINCVCMGKQKKKTAQ